MKNPMAFFLAGFWMSRVILGAELFALADLCASAQTYVEISAIIAQTNRPPTREGHWSFSVECVVGTNEWWIESSGYPRNGRSTWYYDGTNVYDCLQGARSASPSTAAKARTPVTIYVAPSPGGAPLGNLGANIPWLAFCSGSYLKRPGRVVPLPVVDVHGHADSLGYEDKTETFADAFGSARLVELFTSQTRYQASLADERLYRSEWLLSARRKGKSTFADGILRFRYVAGVSTNFNGWTFPLEFSYLDYRPERTGDWSLCAAGAGKVTSIRTASKPKNVFTAGIPQTIIDARFRHPTKRLDAIMYIWTNATVPSIDDPTLQAKFAVQAARADPEPSP